MLKLASYKLHNRNYRSNEPKINIFYKKGNLFAKTEQITFKGIYKLNKFKIKHFINQIYNHGCKHGYDYSSYSYNTSLELYNFKGQLIKEYKNIEIEGFKNIVKKHLLKTFKNNKAL